MLFRSKFETNEKADVEILSVEDSIREEQIKKLKAIKSKRDNKKVKELLSKLEQQAKGTDNLIPTIVEAVENYATLGEIADVLRKVFGEYKS